MTKTNPAGKSARRHAWLAIAGVAAVLCGPAGARAADDADCTACHREPALSAERSAHRASPAGNTGCRDCHAAEGEHPRDGTGSITAFGPRAATPVAVQDERCAACHRSDAARFAGGAHASEDVGCAACHRTHAGTDPMRNPRLQVDACAGCHAPERLDLQKPYGHPVAEGLLGCSDCHAPHDSAVRGSLRRPTVNETCYACHAEKRGPFLFEHAPAAEDCGLCHAPHGSLHPAMLTRRGPLLCQQCHAGQGHPSIVSTPGGLPDGTPSPLLLAGNCQNCHTQVHGSNHPSGVTLGR